MGKMVKTYSNVWLAVVESMGGRRSICWQENTKNQRDDNFECIGLWKACLQLWKLRGQELDKICENENIQTYWLYGFN
jgi:hypothetical protein